MKKHIKNIFSSLVVSVCIFGVSDLNANAAEKTESTNDAAFLSTQKEVSELDKQINEIYTMHNQKMGTIKEEAFMQENVDSFQKLSTKNQLKIQLAENTIKKDIDDEVDKVMSDLGWEKIEDSEEPRFSVNSLSSAISLTRSLYKNSYGYYVYRTDWNWTDGKWDNYADIQDLLAIRTSKDTTENVTAYIYSFDNQGNARHGQVSRKEWHADGVVFNVHDANLTWGWGGTMPIYFTDNGYALFTFKAPLNTQVYTHYEHNWKTSSLSASATFKLIDLKNTAFTVSYNKVNNKWQTVSNPITVK